MEHMKWMNSAWTMDMKVTINESMIKYCDCLVVSVHFMPAKLIKHDVSMFALC